MMKAKFITTKILDHKRQILTLYGAVTILAVLYILIRSENFHSEARFIPLAGSEYLDPARRGFQRIGKLAGLNFGDSDEQFDPGLIEEVIYNRDLFYYIIHQNVPIGFENDSIKFLDYFLNGEEITEEDDIDVSVYNLDSLQIITKNFIATRKDFFTRIQYELDFETNVITIGATFDDPVVAQYVAEIILNYVEAYVIKFKLEKKEREIAYLVERKSQIESKYEETGLQIADFLTNHQDVFDEKIKFEYEKLKNKHDIHYGILNEVSSQLEFEQFELQETKPTFYMIEAPIINIKPVEISPILLLIILYFLAGLGLTTYIFREELVDLIQRI